MARLRSVDDGGMEAPGAAGEALALSPSKWETPLAFLSRCVVVQAIGAAGIVGLCIAGIASKPFEGNNAFLCWLIVGIAALGILCVFLPALARRRVVGDARRPHRIAGYGGRLIIAFSAAKAGGSADLNEIKPMIAAVVDGMYVSLYSTLLGIVPTFG
jgi:hypothetical protein